MQDTPIQVRSAFLLVVVVCLGCSAPRSRTGKMLKHKLRERFRHHRLPDA